MYSVCWPPRKCCGSYDTRRGFLANRALLWFVASITRLDGEAGALEHTLGFVIVGRGAALIVEIKVRGVYMRQL